MQELRVDYWVGKTPWRRKWLPTLVFLPEGFHGQRILVGYSPWGHKELDMTEWLTLPLFQRDLTEISLPFHDMERETARGNSQKTPAKNQKVGFHWSPLTRTLVTWSWTPQPPELLEISVVYFTDFFWYGLFFKIFVEFVTILFRFWFFYFEVCGISAPQPGIKPTAPALEGKVLTTGSSGKSQW